MTAAYSVDLRERALTRKEAGETNREIAAALRISPSCVSKWTKRKRETGSLAPAQIGGYKPRTLSGESADWLRARIAAGPFTLRGLSAELAERGIKTHPRAVWVFVHAEGLSFKKTMLAEEQMRPDAFGAAGSLFGLPVVVVPHGYVSGAPLLGSSTFAGETIAGGDISGEGGCTLRRRSHAFGCIGEIGARIVPGVFSRLNRVCYRVPYTREYSRLRLTPRRGPI